MTCKYCNSGNCYKHEDETEYQEFIPNKEYPVGGFFKIGNEVFKVVEEEEDNGCSYCEFYPDEYDEQCCGNRCLGAGRTDQTPVAFILYDTLE